MSLETAVSRLNAAAAQIRAAGERERRLELRVAELERRLGQQVLDDLRERYDTAVRSGIIHNRLRDWDTGNHPAYALGCWCRLRSYLDSAAAHGVTALGAIRAAIERKPWLPPFPTIG